MTKTAKQLEAEIAETLRNAWTKARDLAQLHPSPENRDAAKAAWAALEAATPRRKKAGFACRAGQRQAAERRAEAAERKARTTRRSR